MGSERQAQAEMRNHMHKPQGLLGRLAGLAHSKHSLFQIAKDKRLQLPKK